jgi:hypothetical protein
MYKYMYKYTCATRNYNQKTITKILQLFHVAKIGPVQCFLQPVGKFKQRCEHEEAAVRFTSV